MTRPRKPGKREGSLILDSVFYDSRLDNLSGSALRLFFELYQQFNGFNNGNLSAAQGNLRFKWNDRTLKNARAELIKAGVIELTRQGVKKRPNLYALTHLPIDECSKNGIKEQKTCTLRATGKREYYFPVRRNIKVELREELSKSKKIKGVNNTH